MGIHWKIWLLEGRSSQETDRGGIVKKGGLGQFTDLRGGLGKEEGGGVFQGRYWYPNAHHGRCH